MNLLKIFFTVFCFSFCVGLAQNDFVVSGSDLQYGVATKLGLEFSYKYPPAFKFSLTGGLGFNIDKIGFSPTVHAGVLLFNKGSIGADQSKKWSKLQSHFFTSAIGVIQLDKRDFEYSERSVPLYHFADFTSNPLQNPYRSSLSYGVNWIFVQNKKTQRIGFLNANIVGRIQISYYNDGGPLLGYPGDNRDRYYTGGLIISYHGNTRDIIDLLELSFHKYTGYQKYAFDAADKLQIDFLNYNDLAQFSFNQQRWRLNFSNIDNGFGGSISLYNFNRLDFQDYLHLKTNVPYHPDYYKGYRWMFGGRHEYNLTKLSK